MYQVVVRRDVVKKAKKLLKPSQRRKFAEFIEVLRENPYPKPPYDLKPGRANGTKGQTRTTSGLGTTGFSTRSIGTTE